MPPTIRPALSVDLEPILGIYNHYVVGSTATFDLEPRSAGAGRKWLLERNPGHPVLVAESDGEVSGWTALGPWSHHGGYAHTCELSIYVRPGKTGRGIGTRLLDAILIRGADLGHRCIIARICTENAGSRNMHERAGFEPIGVMRQAGEKHGRLLDVLLLQKLLTPAPDFGPATGHAHEA